MLHDFFFFSAFSTILTALVCKERTTVEVFSEVADISCEEKSKQLN